MEIKKMKISELKAAAYNPRKDLKPGDAEFEKLKRSIQEFGYVEPIIWNMMFMKGRTKWRKTKLI